MSQSLARVVEAGGLAAALLLPLWFNPYAHLPFEPAKIALFWAIAAAMALAWLGWRLLGLREHPLRPASDASLISASRVPGRWLCWMAVAYAGVVLVATAASINPLLSLWGERENPRGAFTILLGVIFFLLLVDVLRRPAQVTRLVRVLILASVPVIVYGFAQALGLDPLPWITNSVSPVHATLGRSNFLGAYLAMVAPWTLAFAVAGEEPAVRRRFMVIFALQSVCLALTLARGAWIGLTAGCVGFLTILALGWREPRLGLYAGIALIAGCAVLAAMTFVRLPGGREQAQAAGMSYPQLRAELTLRRGIIWQHALTLAPARWLLGYGPATFERVFSERYPPGTLYQGKDAVVDDPHNLLIERLAGHRPGRAHRLWRHRGRFLHGHSRRLATQARAVDRGAGCRGGRLDGRIPGAGAVQSRRRRAHRAVLAGTGHHGRPGQNGRHRPILKLKHCHVARRGQFAQLRDRIVAIPGGSLRSSRCLCH